MLNKYETTVTKGNSTIKIEVTLGVTPPSCAITLTHTVHGGISAPPMTAYLSPVPTNPLDVEVRAWTPQSAFATDYVHLYA
jgi:hypothetical protein